jgi:hypothetical protein
MEYNVNTKTDARNRAVPHYEFIWTDKIIVGLFVEPVTAYEV